MTINILSISIVLLASASLSIIVTKSDAFEWLRNKFVINEFWEAFEKKAPGTIPKYYKFLNKVLNCPLCFGFYSYFICMGISFIPAVGLHILLALCASIISMLIWSKI